jgi:hypothetical protein
METNCNRNCPSTKDLYDHGIPHINFERVIRSQSAYQSDHQAVQREIAGIFISVDDYKNDNSSPGLDYGSAFLIMQERHVETEVHIRNLFSDLITIMGLYDELHIMSALTISQGLSCSGHADLRVIDAFGRITCVVVVKSPVSDGVQQPTKHILDNVEVLGRAYDYVLELQNYYGQRDIFVILTTMKDWKLTWLPQCSGPAATSTLPPKEEWGAASDALPVLPTAREICSTGVLSHDDPRLIRLLLSAVAKCAASPLHPVPVLCVTRLYITLTAAEWRWVRMTPDTVSDFNDRISFAQKKVMEPTTEYTVLKSMIEGSDHNVWTVIAGQPPAVCVVKQTDTVDDAEYEAEIWRTVNQSPNAYCAQVANKPSMVMPFAFPAVEVGCVVKFSYDAHSWTAEGEAARCSVPTRLTQEIATVQQQVAERGLSNVRTAAALAIERLAAHGVQHNDLEWRHVAILPVYEGGVIVDVLPVLTDFERSRSAVGVATAVARAAMMARLEAMSLQVVFE